MFSSINVNYLMSNFELITFKYSRYFILAAVSPTWSLEKKNSYKCEY